MVVLLISLVLVLVAIVVVVRLLLAELARTAAYRQQDARAPVPAAAPTVEPTRAKVGVSAGAVVAASAPAALPGSASAPPQPSPAPGPTGVVPADLEAAPRRRDVERAVRAPWWRRLRSGTALVILVALLGTAAAGVIGAIALFLAFVFDQALR